MFTIGKLVTYHYQIPQCECFDSTLCILSSFISDQNVALYVAKAADGANLYRYHFVVSGRSLS